MAYDRNNPVDLALLKTEVNVDPIGMGYDATGGTQQILKLLNAPANNVNNDTANRIFDAESLLDALDPGDLDAQQTNSHAAEYCALLVNGCGQSIEAYKAKFRSMFAGNSATVQALDAQTSPLSRAEVLFGQGTTISRDDWFAARDS